MANLNDGKLGDLVSTPPFILENTMLETIITAYLIVLLCLCAAASIFCVWGKDRDLASFVGWQGLALLCLIALPMWGAPL